MPATTSQVAELVELVGFESMADNEISNFVAQYRALLADKLGEEKAEAREHALAVMANALNEQRGALRNTAIEIYARTLDDQTVGALISLYRSKAWLVHQQATTAVADEMVSVVGPWINTALETVANEVARILGVAADGAVVPVPAPAQQ